MRCHYRAPARIMIAMLAGLVISRRVSLRIQKINHGAYASSTSGGIRGRKNVSSKR